MLIWNYTARKVSGETIEAGGDMDCCLLFSEEVLCADEEKEIGQQERNYT